MLTTLVISYILSFVASVLQVLYLPTLSIMILHQGYTTLDIGLIGGISSIIYTLGSISSGLVTKRLGEKNTVAVSLLLLFASYITMPFSHNWESIALKASVGLFSYSLFWPSLESIISTNHGSVSMFSFSWSSGTLFGSTLATLILIIDLRTMLASYAVVSALMVIASLEISHVRSKTSYDISINDIVNGIFRLVGSWKLSFAYAASLGGILAYYPVIVEVKSFPVWNVSTLLFSMILARTIIFFLYDRIKGTSLKPLYGSALLLAPLAIPFIPNTLAVVSLGVFAGCGQGILYAISLEKAFTTEEHLRTVYTGLFEASIGLGYSLGPLIGGIFSQPLIELSIITSTLLAIIISLLPLNSD